MKLEKLYNLAHENKIDIHWFNLKHLGFLGLNVEKEGLPHMIFLDPSIKQDNKLYLEVLAHELGHYFTTVGNFINKPDIYSDNLQINKCEYKADKWACEFLITEEEIIRALNKNYVTSIHELANELEVSVHFSEKRLEYLSKQKQMLDLGKDKYLILTNLPNFYVYEFIGGQHGN
jgi:Zn-dependent peptidase ImmA (M78 family)